MEGSNASRFSESRIRWTLGLMAAGAFATLLGLEVATHDGPVRPLQLLLEAIELSLTLAAAAGFTLLAARLHAQQEEKDSLARDLAFARADGQMWRARVQAHVDGLGAAIAQQFDAWHLSGAEAAVALLMIKGYSHKEIGALRRTSEATVRQQARSIYDKAGLKGGRTALSAYFLEDLLPAAASASDPGAAPPARARADTAVAIEPRSTA